jgi:hypothetical protein
MHVSSNGRRGRAAIAKTALAIAVAGGLIALTSPPTLARPAWDDAPVHVRHDVRPLPRVVDVRVGAHRAFDRVVIDLHGKLPGYDVRYVRRLSYDGSGEHVPLRGRKFISIALMPARTQDAHGHSVYTGPRLRQYRFDALRGVAFTGDFEGVVSFGLSLRHRSDFRVTVLHAPNRIVIDLKH